MNGGSLIVDVAPRSKLLVLRAAALPSSLASRKLNGTGEMDENRANPADLRCVRLHGSAFGASVGGSTVGGSTFDCNLVGFFRGVAR